MSFRGLVGVGLWCLVGCLTYTSGLDLPPAAADALRLELQGRMGEAFDRYLAALSSDELLSDDSDAQRPETIYVLSKAAFLALDLGKGEEAWDLAGRLLSSPVLSGVQPGAVVRLRLLRLQGRPNDAEALIAQLNRRFPQGPWGVSFRNEVAKLRGNEPSPYRDKSAGSDWTLIETPADQWGVPFQESVRVSVGAFQDWGRALTLIDMMREKGWVPLVDIRTNSQGVRLNLVYIISRDPNTDRQRLHAQGLLD